jgi:ABC-type lipoprotein export system ATPase subunit
LDQGTGLISPLTGEINYDNTAISSWSESEITQFRLKNIGYSSQDNHAINHWTIAQNLSLSGRSSSQISKSLAALCLSELKLDQRCENLSGGEKHRLSLARIALQQPRLALIDEPTAHLDDPTTHLTMKHLCSQLKASTLIVVSHDARIKDFNFNVFEMPTPPSRDLK